MGLTVEERAFYDANGYVLKKGLLSHDWIVEVKREIEDLIGADISLFHSKLLMKAAQDGTAIPRMNTFAYNVTGNSEGQCREVLRGSVL